MGFEICFVMPALGAEYSDLALLAGISGREQSVQHHNQIFNIFPVQLTHENNH